MSAPIVVYGGETRLLEVEMGGSLASGDSFTGSPTIAVTHRRTGTDATDDFVAQTPAAPAMSGTKARWWTASLPTDATGVYDGEASCATTLGETIVERFVIVLQ